jgi:hypothetical protein
VTEDCDQTPEEPVCEDCDGGDGTNGCTYTVGITGGTLAGTYVFKPRGGCFWSLDYSTGQNGYMQKLENGSWKMVLTVAGCTGTFTAPASVCPPTSGWKRTTLTGTCTGDPQVTTVVEVCDPTVPACGFKDGQGGTGNSTRVVDITPALNTTGVDPMTFLFQYGSFSNQAKFIVRDRFGDIILNSNCVATNGQAVEALVLGSDQTPLLIEVTSDCGDGQNHWYWKLVCDTTNNNCDAVCNAECRFVVTISGGGLSGTYNMLPRGNCVWSTDGGGPSFIHKGEEGWEMVIDNGTAGCLARFTTELETTCPSPAMADWTLVSNTCSFAVSITAMSKPCDVVDPTPGCDFFEKAGGGDEGYSKSFDISTAFENSVSEANFDVIFESYTQKDRMKIYAKGQDWNDPSVTPAIYDSGCIGTAGPLLITKLIGVHQSPIRVVVIPHCAGGTGTNWYWRMTCTTPIGPCCECDFSITTTGIATASGTDTLKYRGNCTWSTDVQVDGCVAPSARKWYHILRYFGGKWTLSVSDGCSAAVWDSEPTVDPCPPTSISAWHLILNQFSGTPTFTLTEGDCGVDPGPCNFRVKQAGGNEGMDRKFDLAPAFIGGDPRLFTFTYNTMSEADRIKVYDSSNTLLLDTSCVTTNIEVAVQFTLTASQGPLRVVVLADCNNTGMSSWYWDLTCTDISDTSCFWTWFSDYDCDTGWGAVVFDNSVCSTLPPYPLNTWTKVSDITNGCRWAYVKTTGTCTGDCNDATFVGTYCVSFSGIVDPTYNTSSTYTGGPGGFSEDAGGGGTLACQGDGTWRLVKHATEFFGTANPDGSPKTGSFVQSGGPSPGWEAIVVTVTSGVTCVVEASCGLQNFCITIAGTGGPLDGPRTWTTTGSPPYLSWSTTGVTGALLRAEWIGGVRKWHLQMDTLHWYAPKSGSCPDVETFTGTTGTVAITAGVC